MEEISIMDIQSEKDELVRILTGINETRKIELLKAFFRSIQSGPRVTLNADEKAAIDKGLHSIEEGRTRSHDEVMSLTGKRYPNLFK